MGRDIRNGSLELGINFIDTANTYSEGTSEEIVGRALRDFARREEIVLATKVKLGLSVAAAVCPPFRERRSHSCH
jgi:aryl-alcohol dehydrogenase-like predicted oxidoreductase